MADKVIWSDWPNILAETIRAILESGCHPRSLKDARFNLECYSEQVGDTRPIKVLATAPPEQASRTIVCACHECTYHGMVVRQWETMQKPSANPVEMSMNQTEQPQAVSAGALSADWWEQEALDVIRSANAYGLPPTKARWISCITTGLLRAFNRGQAELAAPAASKPEAAK